MTLTRDDEELLLLHNPRCSKSRAVHAILTEAGRAFRERRYMDEPLDRAELEELRARLGRPVSEWIRRGEGAFAEARIGAGAGDAELLDAIAAHPILLERPIVVRGAQAVVGRPPEAVRSLF